MRFFLLRKFNTNKEKCVKMKIVGKIATKNMTTKKSMNTIPEIYTKCKIYSKI